MESRFPFAKLWHFYTETKEETSHEVSFKFQFDNQIVIVY